MPLDDGFLFKRASSGPVYCGVPGLLTLTEGLIMFLSGTLPSDTPTGYSLSQPQGGGVVLSVGVEDVVVDFVVVLSVVVVGVVVVSVVVLSVVVVGVVVASLVVLSVVEVDVVVLSVVVVVGVVADLVVVDSVVVLSVVVVGVVVLSMVVVVFEVDGGEHL